MTVLPLEVLTIIFEELKSKDLAQCQLVNRMWNEASLKQLYTSIKINTEEKSRLYVRTIKSSPKLGKFLNSINTGSLFELKDDPIWDTHRLFDAILNYCPNLLRLCYDTRYTQFWTKLMYAASQGQLSRLQYMDCPYNSDYDHYVYTALAFKNTLTTLKLPDLENDVTNLLDSEAYPTLRNSFNEFPCLHTLIINYASIQPLSHYDGLIDDCKHLRTLEIITTNCHAYEVITAYVPFIYPRPDIHTFACRWFCIKEDEQLNYFMQKFPNLKSLRVECYGFDSEYFSRESTDTLMKFLRFALNLQKIELSMLLEEQECVQVWANIINEKFKNIKLMLSISSIEEFDNPVVFVRFNEKNQLLLQFTPSEDTESLYTKLLSNSGDNIQHFTINIFNKDREKDLYIDEDSDEDSYDSSMIFNNIQKIIHVLQLCPSLQCLELWGFHDIPFSNSITYRHFNVKSLTLILPREGAAIGILKNMSLILPNLKEMVYDTNKTYYNMSKVTTIIMPNTSLDVLKWKFSEPDDKTNNSFEIYIKCNINSIERFYVAIEDELSLIGPKNFYRPRSSKNAYLDLTFQNLKKLQINKFTYIF